MAFGRLERAARPAPMSDINMTPLIDVMLVLLVIFIITAPLMTSSLKLDLPRAEGGQPNESPAFVSLALDAKGQLYLADLPIEREVLVSRIRETAGRDPMTEVHLRADSSVPYGDVASLIGLVQEGGLSRIGFVTQAPSR